MKPQNSYKSAKDAERANFLIILPTSKICSFIVCLTPNDFSECAKYGVIKLSMLYYNYNNYKAIGDVLRWYYSIRGFFMERAVPPKYMRGDMRNNLRFHRPKIAIIFGTVSFSCWKFNLCRRNLTRVRYKRSNCQKKLFFLQQNERGGVIYMKQEVTYAENLCRSRNRIFLFLSF